MAEDIHIPAAALEAGARGIYYKRYGANALEWSDAPEWIRQGCENEARAAFLAIVKAWPGMQHVKGYFTHNTDYYEPAFILPLALEPTNDR
jgi:hypothetical protein